MKICPNCHKEFDDNHKFCGNCGIELVPQKFFCPKCGKELKAGQTFCGECGTKISDDTLKNISEKARQISETVRDKAADIVSKENIDKAATQINKIASTVKNSEFFANAKDNIQQGSQNFSQSVKNFNTQDFSFDLIKMFPTSDSQYDAYLKWILIYYVSSVILVGLFFISVEIKDFEMAKYFIGTIIAIPNLYITIYILIKSGVIKYIAKILLGLFISTLILSLGGIAGPFGVIVLFILMVSFSIHINRKRLAFLKNNWRYIYYPIGIWLISSIINFIAFLLDKYSTMALISSIISITGFFILYYLTRRFMRQEQKRGISFLEMNKRFWSVPITLIFYLFSFLTIFHFFDADSGSIINGDLADGNLSDSDLNAIEVASADNSNHVTQNVMPINTATNTHGQNVDSIINTSHTIQESGDIGKPSFHNELLDTTNNISEVPTSDNNHNPLQNSDYTVTDKIGHTVMHFDSEHGILYDGHGKMIATLQGPKNDYLVTTDGKTIARYDPNMKILYDGFNQPLDVKMDGGTFQHIKDAKGNGVEIINGEIFDAKTHKRIGDLEA